MVLWLWVKYRTIRKNHKDRRILFQAVYRNMTVSYGTGTGRKVYKERRSKYFTAVVVFWALLTEVSYNFFSEMEKTILVSMHWVYDCIRLHFQTDGVSSLTLTLRLSTGIGVAIKQPRWPGVDRCLHARARGPRPRGRRCQQMALPVARMRKTIERHAH